MHQYISNKKDKIALQVELASIEQVKYKIIGVLHGLMFATLALCYSFF